MTAGGQDRQDWWELEGDRGSADFPAPSIGSVPNTPMTKHIRRTLPDEKEITEAHEIRGGTSLLKHTKTNLTGIFCLVRQGSPSLREEPYLKMLDPGQKAPNKIPRLTKSTTIKLPQ